MEYLQLIIIGITLSLDAFSLSLALGLNDISNKNKNILTVSIGIFHFVMPLLGMLIGSKLLKIILIDIKYILILVFLFIIIEIIRSFKENESINVTNSIEYVFLAFMVAIDSFSIGIGLEYITSKYIMSSIIFMTCSSVITYIALLLGKYISKKIGTYSKVLEIAILFTLIIYYLCK